MKVVFVFADSRYSFRHITEKESVPRDGDVVFVHNGHFSVGNVIWYDDRVEVVLWKSAASAMMDEE